MRMPTSSSFILATLASSSSLSSLAAAAPTEGQDSTAMSQQHAGNAQAGAPGGLPNVLGLAHGAGIPGLQRDLEARGGLLDTITGLLPPGLLDPILDIVLKTLGLQKAGASTASIMSALTPEQITQVRSAVQAAVGNVKLPIPLPANTGANQAPPSGHTARADAADNNSNNNGGGSGHAGFLPFILAADMESTSTITTYPSSAYPTSSSEPSPAPTGTFDAAAAPSPPSSAPALPVGAPALPIGAPALPVGAPAPPAGLPSPPVDIPAAPFSPLPPNAPPNTPAAPSAPAPGANAESVKGAAPLAGGVPPLFAGTIPGFSAAGLMRTNSTAANATETGSVSGAHSTAA